MDEYNIHFKDIDLEIENIDTSLNELKDEI